MSNDERETIPFTSVALSAVEKQTVLQALESGHVHGDGPFARRCERWLEKHHQTRRALLTHSCTGALEMAALLVDIGPGDEVILPSYTFVSTANAFVLRGATPVFVDIRPDTLNLDEALVAKAVNAQTKAIVPVHYGGVGCAMGRLMEIAQDADIAVIEDAAQGITATLDDRPLGSIGHLGCLSFHGTKNLVAGEGGALLVNDDRYLERSETIREKGTNRAAFLAGQVDKYTWQDVGSSFLMSEMAAALLHGQLTRAEELQQRRIRVWERYQDAFQSIEKTGRVRRPQTPVSVGHNAHVYYLLFDSLKAREEVRAALRDAGIGASFHYVPLHSSPAGQRYGRVASTMAVTEAVSDGLLRLPLYADLEVKRQDRIIEKVLALLSA
jgi:dTDP-4-amino-4,6-dideoxygalactose transaminase